tara:strand:+ start:95 stop:757 length:663 start_codon:yes stop_codon:yes gene_type:complete
MDLNAFLVKRHTEIWKQIDDFPDYDISSLGRVRSNKRAKSTILRPATNPKGYLHLSFRRDGKTFDRKPHILVAKTFIPNINNYPTVDHFDRIKLHNHVMILRWATREMQNRNHSNYRTDISETDPVKRKQITDKEYNKNYYDKNTDYFKNYHSEKYQEDPELYKAKSKYYKDKNREYNKEKIKCECGDIVSRSCLKKHQKRQTHIKKMLVLTSEHKIQGC